MKCCRSLELARQPPRLGPASSAIVAAIGPLIRVPIRLPSLQTQRPHSAFLVPSGRSVLFRARDRRCAFRLSRHSCDLTDCDARCGVAGPFQQAVCLFVSFRLDRGQRPQEAGPKKLLVRAETMTITSLAWYSTALTSWRAKQAVTARIMYCARGRRRTVRTSGSLEAVLGSTPRRQCLRPPSVSSGAQE